MVCKSNSWAEDVKNLFALYVMNGSCVPKAALIHLDKIHLGLAAMIMTGSTVSSLRSAFRCCLKVQKVAGATA